MARLRFNNQFGTITDNPLTLGSTAFNSAALAALPAVVAPDYVVVVLEPDTANEEVVWITAHTASATVATIWRGREKTAAVAHNVTSLWRHGPTVRDFVEPAKAWLSIPPGWDDLLQAQLYKAFVGTGICNIAGIGESVQVGRQTTDQVNNPYLALIRRALCGAGFTGNAARGFPLYGDFWDVKNSIDYEFNFPVSSGSPPWIITTANAGTQLGYGLNYVLYNKNIAVNALATFTPPISDLITLGKCSSIEVLMFDIISGAFKWNVDGGADQTATQTALQIMKKLSGGVLTGLSNASHSVNFKDATVAQGSMAIQGASCFPFPAVGSGVFFGRFAYSGALIAMMARLDTLPPDKTIWWQGNSNPHPGPFNTGNFTPPMAPHCAIIEIGANDGGGLGGFSTTDGLYQGYGPTGFRYGLQRLIDALRKGQPGCSIMLVVPAVPNTFSSDYTYDTTDNPINIAYYTEITQEIAQFNNCAVLNLQNKWGQSPVSLGFMTATDFHPTDAGHADIASAILDVI